MMKKEYKYKVIQELNGDSTIIIPPELLQDKPENEMVYLSDFLPRIPSRCVFLKGVTGCGATSLALQDDSHCIVALPTRNTVQSKWVIRDKEKNIIGYDTDLLCIYGGFNDTKEALINYLNERAKNSLPAKIVCTYDQVEKLVMRLIGKIQTKEGGYVQDESANALCINIKKYRLYIDEVHQVLDDYKTPGRRKNIRGLLNCIRLFDDVTCITATPLERKYFFYEIRDLPIVRVDYEGFFKLNPHYEELKRKIFLQKCKQLPSTCVKLVKEHLEGKAFGNAHIFVNSVDFIAKIIKAITEDEGVDIATFKDKIRIVCGDNEVNERKIKKAVSNLVKTKDVIAQARNINLAQEVDKAVMEQMRDYKNMGALISSINSPTKKINFYTASAWLGADVFDSTGQIYILSDGARKYTMADISTAYIQILGRIRDSLNKKVIHLYSENRYISEGEDFITQFETDQKNRQKQTGTLLKWFNEDKELVMKIPEEERESSYYLVYNERTGKLEYDEYLQWNDEISNKVIKGQYASEGNMTIQMIKNGWNVECAKKMEEAEAEKLKRNKNARTSFEKIFKEYAKLKEGVGMASLFADVNAMITLLEAKEKILYDAYHILGVDVVKALGYKRREITREIEMRKDAGENAKITRLLNLYFQPGGKYTNARIEEGLLSIQEKLHLRTKLKLKDFFEVEGCSIRIGDKVVRGKKVIKHLSTKKGTK